MSENTEALAPRQDYFETTPIGKLLAKFAVPCVISLIVTALYNIVDQIFIGQGVGYIANGATNVVFPITVIAMGFVFMISDGGAAFFSLKLGEKNQEDAARGVCASICMLIICAASFIILGLIFLVPMIKLFGGTENNFSLALDYGKIIVIGLPFMSIGSGMNSIIRADGRPKFAMAVMLAGALVNTILDPLFIFVFHWGVKGAAYATILGQLVSCFLSLLYLRHFKSIKIRKEYFRPNLSMWFTIASYGISSFITQAAITIVVGVTNNLLKDYGALSVYGSDIPQAAFGIVMKVNQILISVIVGIAVGAQPIVGYNYGARNFKRVKQTYLISVIVSTSIIFIGYLVFQITPQTIINLFGQEEALYNEFAQKCFRLFLKAVFFAGFQICSSIFFQAIGKPIRSSVLSLSRQILFLVPSAIILSSRIGVEGVLWSGPVADTMAFMLAAVLISFELKHLNSKINENGNQ